MNLGMKRIAIAATIGLLAAGGLAQDTLILDDFDGDNSDELFGDQGLIGLFSGTILPFIQQDDDFITANDIGAVRYVDTDPGGVGFVVGQWPADAGQDGVELELDFVDLGIIGFEIDFVDVADPFPFGFTIFDDGPSGTPERKIAAVDATIPAGDSTFSTLFTDPAWNIENGFEFEKIGSVYYGLNINARSVGGAIPQQTLVDITVLELRAILRCEADLSSPVNPGVPDNALTGADFFEFLRLFQIGDLRADFSSPTDPGVPDGVLTGADFFEFLDAFQRGC